MNGFRYATDEIVNKGEKIVWATDLKQYGRAFWFYGIQAIEANKCDYCQAWNYDADGLKNKMKETGVNYIGIFKVDSESHKKYDSLLKGKETVFENDEVAIYVFDHTMTSAK